MHDAHATVPARPLPPDSDSEGRWGAAGALGATWHLACVEGPDIGVVLPVPAVLGRSQLLPLNDPAVSRRHASLSDEGGTVRVRDEGSENGTRITWGPFTTVVGRAGRRLRPGCRLTVGEDVFVVRRRPRRLNWRQAPPRRRRLWTLAPLVLFTAFALVRFAAISPIRSPLVLAIVAALLVGGGTALVRWLMRRRRAWRPVDAAHLALVLAADAPAAPPSAGHPDGLVWETPTRRSASVALEAGARPAFGCVGPWAEENAWWIAAQIAHHRGGARLTTSGGRRVNIGEGDERIHLCRTSTCPHCQEKPDEADAWHIGVGDDYSALPSWCTHIIDSDSPAASSLWLHQIASTGPQAQSLPSTVSFADLEQAPSAASAPYRSLAVPIAAAARGFTSVDLVADGPHALIAGTTGSGKSEALLTWLLGMARRYSPDELRFVLVDYKGGATFAPLATLPHTDRVFTDLDPAHTTRALRGIASLLTRRERELSELGYADYAQWADSCAATGGAPPPRIVVVIDEFRVLTDGHPEAAAILSRIAAQGRSLGLHLIIATQRPQGAVPASMRANIDLRIALRCVSDGDSIDVIGTAGAARLERLPGRAIIGGETIHFARINDIVAECTQVGALVDTPSPLPWAPELPECATWQECEALIGSDAKAAATSATCAIAILDGIDEGHHHPLVHDGGHILLEAPAHESALLSRAVRSLALRLSSELHVPLHACSSSPVESSVSSLTCDDGQDLGILLTSITDHGPSVLAVDDGAAARRALGRAYGPVAANDMWERMLHECRERGIVLICAEAGVPRQAGQATHFPTRFIRVSSREALSFAGVPHSSDLPTSESQWICASKGSHPVLAVIPDALEASTVGEPIDDATFRVRSWALITDQSSPGRTGSPLLYAGDAWDRLRVTNASEWAVMGDSTGRIEKWIRREYRLRGRPDPLIEHITWQMLPAPGLLHDRVLLLMCPPREALAALSGRGHDIPDALAIRHWQPDTGLIRLKGVWKRVRVV